MKTLRWAALATLVCLMLAGCSEIRGPEGLTPTEQACINGNSGELEHVKQCDELKPGEREATLKIAHDKQVESEAHEAEKVIKQRHAEELASIAEGR